MSSIASPACPDVSSEAVPSEEVSSSSEYEVQKEVAESNHLLLLPVEVKDCQLTSNNL